MTSSIDNRGKLLTHQTKKKKKYGAQKEKRSQKGMSCLRT